MIDVKNLICWGKIQSARWHEKNRILANVETFAGSINYDVPVIQEFGITGLPPAGARCLLVALNADAESLVCVSTGSSSFHPSPVGQGETLISSNKNTAVHLKDNIEMTGNTEVKGNTNITGNEELTGTLKVDGKATMQDIDAKMIMAMTVMATTVTTANLAIASPTGEPAPLSLNGSSISLNAGGNELVSVIIELVNIFISITRDQDLRRRYTAVRDKLNAIAGN